MDYDFETLALQEVLDDRSERCRFLLREHLTDTELNKLNDALDAYAALVDEEQIRRIEHRR